MFRRTGTFFTRLLILLAVFVGIASVILLILGLMQSSSVSATGPTYVSSGIFEDTTWSASQSPYIVTESVAIFAGLKLTIEGGVEVRFDPGTALIVRGTLIAEGTQEKQIVLTSNVADPTNGSWTGIEVDNLQGGNAWIKFATISYAEEALSVKCCNAGGPVNISDSVFAENTVALGGYAASFKVQVKRCAFENNIYAVTSGYKRISNSIFRNNVYGFYKTEGINVYGSLFIGNEVALYGGSAEVRDSMIIANGIGVRPYWYAFSLYSNTITSNNVGVILGLSNPERKPTAKMNYNNIYNNAAYNMKNEGPWNENATENWWGTTDPDAIIAGIYDGRDDNEQGLVIFKPFRQEKVNLPDFGFSIRQLIPLVIDNS